MRAVTVDREQRLALQEVEPPVPKEGWLNVGVDFCGICGSDLHFLNSPIAREGIVLGHEFAGRVVGAADGVADLDIGDRVVVLPAQRCDPNSDKRCRPCREGASQRCALQAATSLGIALPGAFAENVLVPASSCRKLADGTTSQAAALVEPLAVALHAIALSSFEGEEDVLVIGAGPIGLLMTMALGSMGAGHIAVAEPNAERRNRAARAGADATAASVTQLARGAPPSIVFECAGVAEAPAAAIAAVRPGGEVILVGVTDPQESVRIPSLFWVVKEVGVKGAIAYTNEEFDVALEMIEAGRIDPDAVITSIRSLGEAQDCVDELRRGEQVKVLLSPSL